MGPLAGLKVIEFAGIGPGPFAAMVLADMDADVLRIDRLPGSRADDEVPMVGEVLNRGRPSVGIDLKSPKGVEAVVRLVESADALIEGFRPGVMERLGLGPDVCMARQPKLVYGRMTGWGQSGPLAHAAGHDINYIALAGALHPIGEAGFPPPVPLNLLGDFGGGGMLLAYAVAAALLERERSGLGQFVEVAVSEGVAALMASIFQVDAMGEWDPQRGSNWLQGAAPWYRAYETADGRYLTIGPLEPQFYAQLLARLGLDLAAWPQWDR